MMKLDLERQIRSLVQQTFEVEVDVELTRPEETFGDFATNIALQLSKRLGRNPRDIAAELAEAVKALETVMSVDIAGPGFLNIRMNDAALIGATDTPQTGSLAGKTVLVEYSDPNPFKPLHAGHLYTTLVGDTIARLVQRAGAVTIRLNYGGDVGRHVAIAMWEIIHRYGGEDQALEAMQAMNTADMHEKAAFLGDCYAKGTAAFEEDEAAKQAILETNKRVYVLHDENDHDSTFARIYWMGRDWSYAYFAKLYEELQVEPFIRYIPESEVTPIGLSTVREQLARGVYQESDGAVVFRGEEHGLHTRVFINSEGLPTYETKDVGLNLTKWNDYHFDQSIVITANEQAQYMQVVFASIAQFAPEIIERTRHLTHGVVKLQGGVKMSSRRGNVVTAMDILAAARAAGEASGTNPSEETILAAVKYAFARARIGGDIIYDPSESVALEGNSGPYIQYAYARANSILAKATTEVDGDLSARELDAAERSLVLKIGEYAEVLDRATAEFLPHHICTYLYELAQAFNRFYEGNRVLGDDRELHRMNLVARYASTLKDGLNMLGITAPERM